LTAPDRRSAIAIATEVNGRRLSAVTVAEETLGRIARYDAIQPQIWISKSTRDVVIATVRQSFFPATAQSGGQNADC